MVGPDGYKIAQVLHTLGQFQLQEFYFELSWGGGFAGDEVVHLKQFLNYEIKYWFERSPIVVSIGQELYDCGLVSIKPTMTMSPFVYTTAAYAKHFFLCSQIAGSK